MSVRLAMAYLNSVYESLSISSTYHRLLLFRTKVVVRGISILIMIIPSYALDNIIYKTHANNNSFDF